jgi:hypothetical protein
MPLNTKCFEMVIFNLLNQSKEFIKIYLIQGKLTLSTKPNL